MDGKWLGFPAQHQSLLLVCNPLCSANEPRCNSLSQLHWYQLGLHSTASLWPIMWIGARLSSFCAIQLVIQSTALHAIALKGIRLHMIARCCTELTPCTLNLVSCVNKYLLFLSGRLASAWSISVQSQSQHSRQFRKINRFCSESVPCQGWALIAGYTDTT